MAPLAGTLVKGALGSLSKRGPYEDARLPGRRLARSAVEVDPKRLDRYRQVCGFPRTGTLPPSYPHVLGFPLAMRLMASGDFPFPLMGLVHTGIEVTQHHALRPADRPEIRVHTEGLAAHRRGSTFQVVTVARLDGEEVWDSRSTYLCRHRRPEAPHPASRPEPDAECPATTAPDGTTPDGATPEGDGPDGDGRADGGGTGGRRANGAGRPLPAIEEWRLPGDLGRRYAAASGDRNPIHLYPLTARALGFPRALAHGMWTFARCLAEATHGRTELAARARFLAPVLLPATVAYGERDGTFELRGVDDPARLHLSGQVSSVSPASGSADPASRSS